jgi:hypothetical protein
MITETMNEQPMELRRLLRMGVAQANAVVMGRPLAEQRLRTIATDVRDVFLKQLAGEAYREELAELNFLCAWPDDGDDIECALRFDRFGRSLLKTIAQPDGAFQDDLTVGDPFGC